MSFSVKLSDMERQITSYEKTIQRQKAEIDQLTAKLDSKADRVQFKSLQTLLDSKMVALKDETNTKDLLIERYRNKLSQLDSEVTVRGLNPFLIYQGARPKMGIGEKKRVKNCHNKPYFLVNHQVTKSLAEASR